MVSSSFVTDRSKPEVKARVRARSASPSSWTGPNLKSKQGQELGQLLFRHGQVQTLTLKVYQKKTRYVRNWVFKLWIAENTDMGWVHTVHTLLTLSKNGKNTAPAYQVDKETNPNDGFLN
jgi:hypothetical protein